MEFNHPLSDASWDDVRLFLAALQHGSFTAAATALRVGQATMSRRMASLERVIGHSLFDRSRGGLAPTPAAKQLQPWAEAMAASMRNAQASLAGLEVAPAGVVRLTCAPGLAVDFGPMLFRRLRVKHPGIVLEVLADMRTRDIANHEADVALRNVAPAGGPLLVRKLVEFPVGLYASPELLRRLPARPQLRQVPLVGWSEELPALAAALAPLPCPRVMVTNDFLTMCAAVEAGLGAMVTTSGQAAIRGFRRIPTAFPEVANAPLFLVTHQALRHVPRVEAVIQVLDEVVLSLSPSARMKGTSPSPR
jgi:DNA-binding transcriptional LysR family regulator